MAKPNRGGRPEAKTRKELEAELKQVRDKIKAMDNIPSSLQCPMNSWDNAELGYLRTQECKLVERLERTP